MDWVYLDNNATTRPDDAVLEAMHEAGRELWANPSSVHRLGQAVRQRIELARQSVASLINAQPRQIIFTSGGTEANNLALLGLLDAPPRDAEPAPVLLSSPVEHSAVREPAEHLARRGVSVVDLQIDADGRVRPDALEQTLAEHALPGRLVLLSVQWANNETGVIQPIEPIAAAVRQARQAPQGQRPPRIYLHVDAVQAVGKLPVDVATSGVDLLSLAGHKFHGPKGIGALYAGPGVRLRPRQHGGPQERDKRGGTENTPGIIGLGVAADRARDFLADDRALARVQALRDQLEAGITQAVPEAVAHGRDVPRLWNTTNIAFPGLEAEAILLSLSERGVYCSAGAACSSGSLEPSPVLLAMKVPEPVAHGSVRFSLSRYSEQQDVERALNVLPQVIEQLRATLPTG